MFRNRTIGALAIGLAVSAAPVLAQGSEPVLGFKAGVTVATVDLGDLDDTFDKENRTGIGAGLFMLFGSDKVLAIQPELNLLTRGFEYSGAADGTVELGYIQPAVLLKLGIPTAAIRPGVGAVRGGHGRTTPPRCAGHRLPAFPGQLPQP